MNNIVLELQIKYCIFFKSYIIEIGSMVEGIKIGQFDEFDFMIVFFMLVDLDVGEFLYI